ncbi:MAG TPA: translocation/assembly module TamB domain-containing protein [Vicinamibacteria bacterium]|nr:translocation/assembly module TamB domain-containing protein [Vicinamibacteria bacterium]
MSRRRKLLVFVLVLGATVLYVLWRAPEWGARLVEHALGGYFQRPVRLAQLRLRPQTLELELRGLQVGGVTPEAPPFLEAPLVRVKPSLAPFRFDRIVLSRVRVEGLKIRIEAFPDPPIGPGGDDLPKLGGGGGRGRGLQLGIERLVVVDGEFVLNHQRVPLDLDLPDFRGRFDGRPSGGLAGHLSFRPGRLRMGDGPELPVGTDIDLVLERGVLRVEGARLLAENTDLAYTGRLRLAGRPQGQFRLDGAVDLAVLERHVFRSGLGLAGRARWGGLLSVDGSRLRIEGRADGEQAQFLGTPVTRFATALSFDGSSGLVLRDLAVNALGGSGLLGIEVPPGNSGLPLRLRASLNGADGEGLTRLVFGWGGMGFGTAASGSVDVSWPRGRSRSLSGRIGLDLGERADNRVPIGGRLEWTAVEGRQRYERLELHGPAMRARVSGEVDPAGAADLALEAEAAELAVADGVLMRVRRGFGNPEAQPAGVSGGGSFRGRWRGSLDWPVFEGRFSGDRLAYAGVGWGHGEWTGRLDTRAEAIESHSLVLRKAGGELWWDGRSEIGWFGERDRTEGRVRLESWPVEDLVAFMQWRVQASGRVSGEARISGRRSQPEGEARLSARDGRWFAVPYASARLDSRWRGALAELTAGEVALGGGRLRLRGTLSDDGVYDGSAEMDGVDLGTLLPVNGDAPGYGGRLSGRLLLQGTLARPRLRASLSSPRLFFGDEGIGALELQLFGGGDGRLNLEGRCRSARVDLALSGGVGAVPPYDASLTLSARSTSVDPFLRVVRSALPASLSVVASGEARIRGPLQKPDEVRAEASLPELQLLLPEYAVRAREPVRLAFTEGRLELARLHLAGEGTDLDVQGAGDLLGNGPLALTARGRADLRALSFITRRLRGSGQARLAVDVSGTSDSPRVQGTLVLDGAGVRMRGFPHGLEGLQGTVHFTESAAELREVSGTLANGRLTIEGEAAYAGGTLRSYDIRPVARGLALRYPEGLRSLLDAQLRLFGDADKQWVTGTVDVKQALYTRRYDIASELLGARRALQPSEAGSSDEGARLDLRVQAPGTLRIDNNLATLAARADLAVQGTSRAPVITGRAEIERGRLYFQGRTYEVQRGTLDFVNPQRLDPLFDIEAETRVHSYRVTLRVAGTLERVTPTLSSDPPLSSLQILALLAGQDESEVANLTQTQARERQGLLAGTGAATLAAGRLSESVGLEREAERLFGLNRFSIDPSLLRGGATTRTARVTVGKRLTPDLNVLYSQDVRGLEERILAVEYTLTDRFSLLLTHTDPGTAKTGVEQGWGFDVRIRQNR